MNKAICVALIITILGIVILTVALVLYYVAYRNEPNNHHNISTTQYPTGFTTAINSGPTFFPSGPTSRTSASPDWSKIGNLLRQQIDSTTDPCGNFYKFACGGWINRNPLLPGTNGYYRIDAAQDWVYRETASILAETARKTDLPVFARKITIVNNKCLNQSQNSDSKNSQVLNLLAKFGGWPMISPIGSGWKGYNLGKTLGLIQSQFTKNLPFMGLSVLPDLKNPSKHVLYINSGELILSNKLLYNRTSLPNVFNAYWRLFIGLATLLGNDAGLNTQDPTYQQRFANDVEQMFYLETDLAGILPDADPLFTNYTADYHQFTLDSITQSFEITANWKWDEYLTAALPEATQWYVQNKYSKYIVLQENYFKGLKGVLANYDEETVVNYFCCKIIWNLLQMNLIQLDDDAKYDVSHLSKLTKQSVHVLQAANNQPRAEACAEIAINCFPDAIANLFLEQHPVSLDEISSIKSMFISLQSSAVSDIAKQQWLKSGSKEIIVDKLLDMEVNVGFPAAATNSNALNIELQPLNVSTSMGWTETYLSVNKYFSNIIFLRLNSPMNRSTFSVTPLSVLPKYDLTQNSVTFPMGLFESSLLSHSNPDSVKYGVIGHFLGHAMGQILAREGLMFNEDGKLENWMDPTSRNNLNNLLKCYESDKICINSSNIFGPEKCKNCSGIADWLTASAVGLEWAISSFIDAGSPETIPNFDEYSVEQIFYIAAASFTCGLMNQNTTYIYFRMGIFSEEQRFNQLIKYDSKFSKIFNCENSSNMNPKHKCDIWT